MTLATSGPDGEPHAAPLYFASDDDLHLYFLSDPDSQHGRDIARESLASVAFYPVSQSWQDIQGIQMRGHVHIVESGTNWDLAWERYTAKFPFVSTLEDILAKNVMYVFIPHWIRLVDNQQGFGFKKEWYLK